MPRNLGELGEMFSSEEVRELRQGDRTEIQKLRTEKKMLEEKISSLKKLSEPLMAELCVSWDQVWSLTQFFMLSLYS